LKRYLFAALALASVVPANATFVDSGFAGGVQLVTNGVATVSLTAGTMDDGYWTRPLSPGFDFYCRGTALTTVHVSTNGLMSFGVATTDFSNTALNVADISTRYVAPMWDDWDLRPATSPLSLAYINDTATHVSFTVQNSRRFAAGASDTGQDYQGLLIKSNVTISGFNFLAGDIAFSYENIGTVATNSTIGVKYDAVNFTQAPGGSGFGVFDQTAANLLPVDNRFILFRWNQGNPGQTGQYNASIQIIPEPASLAALGLGAALLLRRRRKA